MHTRHRDRDTPQKSRAQGRLSRRSFLLLSLLSACSTPTLSSLGGRTQLTVGAISSLAGQETWQRLQRFQQYLAQQLQVIVQLEPVLNETKALERVQGKAWDLALLPPGLAALALAEHQYLPLLPLFYKDQPRSGQPRSVLVVLAKSQFRDLASLSQQTIALGKPGSATGYYFPLFNLYGLTLETVQFLPTPKAILETLAQGKAAAGALSLEEFNAYQALIPQAQFRILHTDPHPIPPGAILLGPTIERTAQEQIRQALTAIPSEIADEVGFVSNGSAPDYTYMISVVQRVDGIFPIKEKRLNGEMPRPLPIFPPSS